MEEMVNDVCVVNNNEEAVALDNCIEPTESGKKGGLFGTFAAILVTAGAAVTALVLTKEKRKQRKLEKATKFLEKNGRYVYDPAEACMDADAEIELSCEEN